MIQTYRDYRSYLRDTIAEKRRKNPAYSMRAFAKSVGITQSAVSQVLARKKNLSLSTALQVAARLRMSEKETEYFGGLVQLDAAKDPVLRESILKRLTDLDPERPARELDVEIFRLISDWYHLAIRNLTEVAHFDFTPQSIAKRLGISALQAQAAIDRLARLKLIEPDGRSGRYRKTTDQLLAQSSVPNQALRGFHQQMLEKAAEALTTQTPQEKVVGSETFAIADGLLDEARAITEEYFQKMLKLKSRPGKKTNVYHLGVQFFNLTPDPAKTPVKKEKSR